MLKSIAIFTLAAANFAFAEPVVVPTTDKTYTTDFDSIKLPVYNYPGAQVKDLAGQIPLNISGVCRFILLFIINKRKESDANMTISDLLAPGVKGVVTVGVPAASGANVGAYLQGQTVTPTIALPSRAHNTVVSFDLTSLKFGCVVGGTNKKDPTSLSICAVVVNGYRSGRKVASQTFTFSPGRVTKTDMVPALFSSDFKNIDKAIFGTAYSPKVTANGVTLIDDLVFVAHSTDTVTTL